MKDILRIDASARIKKSTTRQLTDALVNRLVEHGHGTQVQERDLGKTQSAPITDEWIGASFAGPALRSDAQRDLLAASDQMIDELEAAKIIVVGFPIYNFSIPASLKAWIDRVVRPERTFRYTDRGPTGLLKGKKAFFAVASGGVALGGKADFATPYMREIFGFMGIVDVTIVAADGQPVEGDSILRAHTLLSEMQRIA